MRTRDKIILDLCGGSGRWSDPYAEAGYDRRNITLPRDARLYMPPPNVYGILAAPVCTHLCVSGARWWKDKGKEPLLESLELVSACCRIILICKRQGGLVFWAMENPVGRLKHFMGEPEMYFNPCDYGDPWTKKTALWGEFNVPVKHPVTPVPMSQNPIHRASPGPDRAAFRSLTPKGFAKYFFEANR